MGRFLASSLVLGLATAAFGAATMDMTYTDLGDGKYGVDVWVHGNDAVEFSFFADMDFVGEQVDPVCQPGLIQQLQYVATMPPQTLDIDDADTAAVYNGYGGYDMVRDSYFFKPWTVNQKDPGIVQAANFYHVEAGTGTTLYYLDLQLAYLVTTGDISYDGYIARQGVNYYMDGTWCIPEPAMLTLIVVGAAAMLRRKR